MRRVTFAWHLVPVVVLIVWGASLLSAMYAARAIRTFHAGQTGAELAAQAKLVRQVITPFLVQANPASVDSICKVFGVASSSRITVVSKSGIVLGETGPIAARLDNHADRPEIIAAFSGRTGSAVRFSHTTRRTMMYTAIPVFQGGEPVAAVRVAKPIDSIEFLVVHLQWRFFLAGAVVALVATVAVLIAIRRATDPLETMRRVAHAYSQGDFRESLPTSRVSEVDDLAQSLNAMARQLDERIRSLVRQRNEQEAVLSSMVEGVIAVDSEERVINLNLAAARLVGADIARSHGRLIQEVVRNTELQQIIRRALDSHEPVEGEIAIRSEPRVFLQAHGTVLRDGTGECIGALVVLNDITRLRTLENMRKEFVANVSHELKTPITSIKASVETLLDGAMENREMARRFLDIVVRHADRLNAIVDDLLSLSRIEQEAENRQIELDALDVEPVLQAAVQSCLVTADERGINIQVSCANDLKARMNAPLIEQAVVNLIDNATKYSDPGGVVHVVAEQKGTEVRIDVRDTGCGIAPEHLQRVFERFYRVDKARSRNAGGTGLGLSIVKHIVQAHGGRVTVESALGKGSTFSLFLPAA
ncbi:MAG TPA: ATP-binding protein [Candidatus Latescibacteria bacterium]|nr:ATP-binding protein [Candidatus Latescibacterota bacterium]